MTYTIQILQKTGLSHRFCEDRYQALLKNGRLLIICADGHGDEKYTRAGLGARFACAAAAKVFADDSCADPISAVKDTYDNMVKKHLAHRPLFDYEEEKVKGIKLTEIYGATLLVAVIGEDYTEFYQVGDGEIYAIKKDGSLFEGLAQDKNCVGKFSTSLALNRDSVLRCARKARFEEPAAACFMFTDGCEGALPLTLEKLLSNSAINIKDLNEIFEQTATSDDQTFLIAYNGECLKNDEFCDNFQKTVNGVKQEIKNEKRRRANIDEFMRLKEYLKKAFETAKEMKKNKNPDFAKYVTDLGPELDRYDELKTLIAN